MATRSSMTFPRCFLAVWAAVSLTTAGAGCVNDPNAFQPIADGARPWQPPPGWDPQPACPTGYFVAIDSCAGCSDISYALCVGNVFDQCVCGGPPWPGAICPQGLPCSENDFPPRNWLEFTDYAGPGWAGLSMGGSKP
jgi:hypothetical protein